MTSDLERRERLAALTTRKRGPPICVFMYFFTQTEQSSPCSPMSFKKGFERHRRIWRGLLTLNDAKPLQFAYWAHGGLIKEMLDEHIPVKQKHKRKNTAPFRNSELRKAINFKKSLWRKFLKVNNERNWKKYIKQSNLVTKLKREPIKLYLVWWRTKVQGLLAYYPHFSYQQRLRY